MSVTADEKGQEDLATQFELSAFVTGIEQPTDIKKDTNLLLNIQIGTTEGLWTVQKTFKEFQVFHANLILNENYRGINLPKLPERKAGNFQGTIDDYLSLKRKEYTEYLNSILRRSFLLGSKSCQEFISAPTKIRKLAKHIAQYQSIPLRSGQMKKEGEKVRNWKSRYFVLFPNYLLRYYESQKTYRDGISPKGSIDLTLARKILVYDESLNPFSFGISTPQRIWRIQCEKQNDRDEWVVALRQLLQSENSNAYIPDYNDINLTNNNSNNNSNINNNNNGLSTPPNNQSRKGSDAQITQIQEKLDSVLKSTEIEKEQIKNELTMTHKEQLRETRETMLEFKNQVEDLANELEDYETKINNLSEKIVEIQQDNNEKDEKITELETTIEHLHNQLTSNQMIINNQRQIMESNDLKIATLNKDLTQYKQNEEEKMDNEIESAVIKNYIEADLYKYQGDTNNKLKLNKTPVLKKVIYLQGTNTLIWRDINNDSAKYMSVTKVTTNDATINANINYHNSWFKVIGTDRIALFASDKMDLRNAWVDYIQECLSQRPPQYPSR